jgi:small-conductance mechanosensitive channel
VEIGTLVAFAVGLADVAPAELVAPLALIAGGLLLGVIFEGLVLKKLKEVAWGTKSGVDDVVLGSVRGVTTLWFGMVGVNLALVKLPLEEAVANFLKDVLLVTLILSMAIVLARIAAGLIGMYATRVQGLPSSSLLTNLARLAILSLGTLMILQSLGIAIAPVMAAMGVGGLAIALALQETLSNLFCGVLIIVSKQLRPGDFVRLDTGEEGYVADVTWRNTTIRALTNNMVIVPNARLAQSVVTNFYQPERSMAVVVPVGVSYDSYLPRVEEVTVEVATEVMTEIEGGVPEFEPSVRFNNFGGFSIDFSVSMQTREVLEQYRIKHEFIKRLHERYGREGIEIPSQFPVVQNGSSTPEGRSRCRHRERDRSALRTMDYD